MVSNPGNGPNADPTSVTATSALWCTRKIGSAFRFSHPTTRGRNTGRTTSAAPICANASASATGVGGARFERCPGTPTALAEYPPYRTSSTHPRAPSTSSGQPHERRSPTRARWTPSCHGAHHTAMTFTAPMSSSTRATGTATAITPRRRSRKRNTGISADSARYAPRNHSGVVTRCTTTRNVTCGNPRNHSPPSTTSHTRSSTTTATTTRRTRPSSGVVDRAAAKPPTKKNSPKVWSTQVAGVNSGMSRSGLSMEMPLTPATVDVTNQCPMTTPAMASARTVSTTGSRPLTAHPRTTVPGTTTPSTRPKSTGACHSRRGQPVPRHHHGREDVRHQVPTPVFPRPVRLLAAHDASPTTTRAICRNTGPPAR